MGRMETIPASRRSQKRFQRIGMGHLGIVIEDNEEERGRKKRRIRAVKWAIFTVIFGVAPLFAVLIVADDSSLNVMIGHGELFLLAAVLTGDAMGRVANKHAMDKVGGILCLGFLGLLLAHSALQFGVVSKDLTTKQLWIKPGHEAWSAINFLAAVIASYFAVGLED
jgi:hypothetical protein